MNTRAKQAITIWITTAVVALLLAIATSDSDAIQPGETYCRNGVCVVREQVLQFIDMAVTIENVMKERGWKDLPRSDQVLALQLLRGEFSDAEIFVMWNAPKGRAALKEALPRAYPVMASIMQDLAWQHRNDTSSLYKIDY